VVIRCSNQRVVPVPGINHVAKIAMIGNTKTAVATVRAAVKRRRVVDANMRFGLRTQQG